MTLTDLFAMLSYGELSNHFMANDGNGTISGDKQPQVVYFANEALMRLYTKFMLKEKDCIIELVEGVTQYHLKPEYSATGFNPAIANYPYIRDTPSNAFIGDVIKVMSVQNSAGEIRPLNDLNSYWSVNTPTSSTIQVNTPRIGEVLSIAYQASHPRLSNAVDGNHNIELPDTLYGALTAYVAYKVYSSMNTQESQIISQGHLAMFDNIANATIEADALNLSISGINTRFSQRGWK